MDDSFKTIEDKKKKRKNIFTFYGGKINFDDPSKSELLYYKDYIEFNTSVNEKIKNIIDSKKKAVIIKLDLQEFYNNIGYFGPNCARLFGFIAPVISVQTAPLP